MTPEGSPPSLIQLINIVIVFLSYKLAKSLFAKRTLASSSVFVGKMPSYDRRMLPVAFRNPCVYLSYLFTVSGGCIAVIVTKTVKISNAVFLNAKHLGIFLRKPTRT